MDGGGAASLILVLGWIGFAVVAACALGFAVTSIHERRWRAAKVAAFLFVPLLGVWAALLLVDYPAREWIVLALAVLGICGALLVTLPIASTPQLRVVGEQKRVDERDALFHRFYRLQPGTSQFDEYYREHPEKLDFDNEDTPISRVCQEPNPALLLITIERATPPFAHALRKVIAQSRFSRGCSARPKPAARAVVSMD